MDWCLCGFRVGRSQNGGKPTFNIEGTKSMVVREDKPGKLLSKYDLGDLLGHGACGVVYQCIDKETNQEFAVKLVDQVETPLSEIQREVEFLTQCAHPCVVKLHDVFYEKVFVCIVLGLHRGGDLIEGMQLHWKIKGVIPLPACQRVTKMMFQGAAWLHQNKLVHRDLKGDNYLQDVPEIENPDCRIYLSDFGTVENCELGQELSKRCGTRTYWSPEFYDRKYGLPVDIWALGVVIFGMVTGRFPFRDEKAVRTREIPAVGRLGDDGQDLMLRMLDRNSKTRIAAHATLLHAWLHDIKFAAEEGNQWDADFKAEVKEAGANAGVKQRRHELVSRLKVAAGAAGSATRSSVALPQSNDLVSEIGGLRHVFKWWTPDQVQEANFYSKEKAVRCNAEDADMQASVQGVQQMLQRHDVDTSRFGQDKAKSVTEFVSELQSGRASLMLDASKHKAVVRVVDLVLLRIVYGEGADKKFLIRTSEKYPDGRVREDFCMLAGCKKLPHENGVRCAQRLVKERLPAVQSSLDFDFKTKEYFEEDSESPSYPGVHTVYRKEIYEAVFKPETAEQLQKVGLGQPEDGGGAAGSCEFSEMDDRRYTHVFAWLSEGECADRQIKLKAPAEGTEVSVLVDPPVGYEEEELTEFLQGSGVDISQFGKDGVKSVAEFSEELVKGESRLHKETDGRLIRIVDVVIMEIHNSAGQTLVETARNVDGTQKETKRLPAVKRRADENPFVAAQRVVKVLQVSENSIWMSEKDVLYVEERTESKAYAGLPTLYRRWIIPAKAVT